ncbi:unnamed protein product, partial [Meganyctiphanes norvegica]
MQRGPGFRFYVTLYLSLCLIINVLLVIYFLWEQSWWNGAKAKDINISNGVDNPTEWNGDDGKILTCSDINRISNLTFLRSGWTKAVYKGKIGNLWVAIKTVNTNGHDMKECQNKDKSFCYARTANKIIKEELLLNELKHSNIIKVYGSCMPVSIYSPGPPASGVVTMVTELGQPLDMLQILQMTFEQRLLIASGLIDILQHLSHCSIGPLLMKDFRRDQFVLVNGVLKLTDVDDISIGETRCQQSSDCGITNSEGVIVITVNCES